MITFIVKLIIKLRGASLGSNVTLGKNLRLSGAKNFLVGNYCYIGPEAYIHAVGGVTIGEGVIIGPRVKIHSSNHNFRSSEHIPYDSKTNFKSVDIGDGTWIGDSVMIAPGVNIGKGCIIGMGVVVTSNVDDYTVVTSSCLKIKKRSIDDIENFNRKHEVGAFYMKWKKSGDEK